MAMSTNNFLENELRKIFGNDDMFSNTKYISGVCYGELDSDLKIKCQIDDSGVSRNYDVLRITVINRKDGVVDKHAIQFLMFGAGFLFRAILISKRVLRLIYGLTTEKRNGMRLHQKKGITKY